jgi:hypothetical protein
MRESACLPSGRLTFCAGSSAQRGLTLLARFAIILATFSSSHGAKMLDAKSYPLFRNLPQGRTIDAREHHPQNASRTGKTPEPAARKAAKNKLKSTLAPRNSMGEYKANDDAI